MNEPKSQSLALSVSGRIAALFQSAQITPLLALVALLLGIFAVMVTPREEEPQIKVPMIDVLVAMPGSSAKEVEERATRPMEKLLWEIPVAVGMADEVTTTTPPPPPQTQAALAPSQDGAVPDATAQSKAVEVVPMSVPLESNAAPPSRSGCSRGKTTVYLTN